MIYSCLQHLALKSLHCLPAETAHTLALSSLRLAAESGIIAASHTSTSPYSFANRQLPNRLGLAAGFDKNGDAIDGLACCGFGFIELGTVTPRAQPGNPKPRLFRLPQHQAIINRMGFNNKGVDYLVERIQHSHSSITKGINIGKNKDTPLESAVDDYRYCLQKAYPVADYITINISSPNTPQLRELQFGNRLRQLLSDLARQRDQLAGQLQKNTPLLLKIAPDMQAEDLTDLIDIVVDCGFDGVIASNTTTDKSAVAGHRHAEEAGGLSGEPLRKKSLAIISHIRQLLPAHCVLIGVGGMSSVEDAEAFRQAGADLLQLYTGFIYQGTRLVNDVCLALGSTQFEG